ncbi:IclR family transcriptional regulator [Halococcus sp. IIIV-5B]|uniref:IclR family transcriptional regulator n=1 Tax=Halococcus sp. IIIV-5B TaxID=2321230 RepID=UPI000E7293D3|nr:IclR family transcriptional regulator [Halococcus sp. IIIV-5B]RJT07906.1 IclR family transcriptional regulator [Halococcus sp. IIIV-5B]
MGNNTTLPVQATQTSFEVIEALRQADGAGVRELAAHLSVPKSTVHDHLRTLTEMGYVVQIDGAYRPSLRFLEIGGETRKRMAIHRVAKPEIQELAIETGDHANLMVEEDGYGIFLSKSEGQRTVNLDTYAGMRVHLHTTALGKSMLAFMDEDRRSSILDRRGLPAVTEYTIDDEETLRAEFEEIRERGYAVDDEERVKGMRCVAAPVIGTDGTVLAAVSVSSPKSRMRGDRFEVEVPSEVQSTVNVIEVNIVHE